MFGNIEGKDARYSLMLCSIKHLRVSAAGGRTWLSVKVRWANRFLCSIALAETPATVYRVVLLHVGPPGRCVLSQAFEDAFARRGFVAGKSVTFAY